MTTSPDKLADLADSLDVGRRYARVQKIQLIRREVREFLSPSAMEVLLSHGEHVVEGDARGVNGQAYATVMLTLDLARCGDLLRERADEATAHRLAELLSDSPWLRGRLVDLARGRLREVTGGPVRAIDIHLEYEVRVEGMRVLIDADGMVRLGEHADAAR